MKNNILLALLFFLIPIIINGQTQVATTSAGLKVILNADGTWEYAKEAMTSDGKKVILNLDGTWKYAEKDRIASEAERKSIEAEQKRQADILNKTRDALANSKNVGTSSTSEGKAGGRGNQGVQTGSVDSKNRGEGRGLGTQGNFSYDLGGRGFQSLPKPRYDYQGEGKVVVEVSVDRSGKVIQAIPGIKGSTTFDEYLFKVAKEAALKARFAPKSDAPALQKGTITYNFVLK
jgi:hypothetical protein